MKRSATFVIFASLFLMATFAFAQITVDGSAADWTGTAPITANSSVYSAGTAGSPVGYNEWIWTDANDDERTDFGSDAQVNLLEARVSGDNSNIYFLFRMEDISIAEGDGAPLVQISVDKDMDGTGTDWLGGNADTQAPSSALWEHLIYTRFGPNSNVEPPHLWDEGWTNNRTAGSAVCSATNDVIEIAVPWTELESPITADNTVLRFTFSFYRQNNSNGDVWDTGGDDSRGDCLDYVTPTTGNTWGALVPFNINGTNDGGILDSYQDITFLNDPDQTLNVHLASFRAVAGNGKVALQWVTESELDNLGFILQRAAEENGDYQEIANYRDNEALKGAGTTSRKTVYVFNDHSVFNGQTYWYKLIDVDMNGVCKEHPVISATPRVNAGDLGMATNGSLPSKYALHQNFPNPFNPGTTIRFEIPDEKEAVNIRLSIYNLAGQKVIDLVKSSLGSGTYEVRWNGRNNFGQPLPSGVYFYVISSENFSASRKLMLMK